jgi:hypothetical protein
VSRRLLSPIAWFAHPHGWEHPYDIGRAYDIDQRVVRHHARVVGLYARLGRNIRTALDAVIQNCNDTTVTSDSIIRPVRAYAPHHRRRAMVSNRLRTLWSDRVHARKTAASPRGSTRILIQTSNNWHPN